FFSVWGGPEESPRTDCGGVWTQCNPGTVEAFSAVGYSFGRQLRESLRIPIGLIRNPWDATRVVAWAPPQSLKDQHATNSAAATNARSIGNGSPTPAEVDPRHRPSALYNGLIAPLTDFPIRGVIWYQGEADLYEAESYESHLRTLISGWRSAWRQAMLPFGVVQIAATSRQTSDARLDASAAKAIQRAQESIHQSNPGVGLVAGDELVDLDGIARHEVVGQRLAEWSLNYVYQLGPGPVADKERNKSAAPH
ncbi:MAG: sialate O-acetylesterase, partial [Pirellulales bacterium]